MLAANRSPDSYVAGDTVVNQGDATARYSNDIELFHDPAASVIACGAVKLATIEAHGYRVSRLLDGRSFIRAMVERDTYCVLIVWATDSAFRSFPVIADAKIGYRLHPVDSATTRCSALAGSQVIVHVTGRCAAQYQWLRWRSCGHADKMRGRRP